MVKCNNCKNKVEDKNKPIVCPECGHIMKPFIEKKVKEKKVIVENEKELELFEE